MKDHPNVTVEQVPVQSDAYEQKMAATMGSDNPPDAFITWGGGKLNSYVDAGKVLDLTKYMNKDNYKDRFIDASLTHVTYKDKIYGVPVENISIALFLYDKDLFAKYGVAVPKTYDELMKACETLKSNGVAPFALGNKFKWPGSMYYMYSVLRYGGSEVFTKAANRLGGSFEDDAFLKAGQLIQDWVDKGYFCEGYNSLDQDAGQPRNLMFAGKAAMMLMGTWEMDTIMAENPDFYKHMGYFTFPELPGGNGNSNDVVGTVGDNFYSISTACKNPDAAFELIQYLIDDTSVQERIKAGKVPPVKNIKGTYGYFML
jgi:raffinose/stachyose/melibiose transport system substrate-binding protein